MAGRTRTLGPLSCPSWAQQPGLLQTIQGRMAGSPGVWDPLSLLSPGHTYTLLLLNTQVRLLSGAPSEAWWLQPWPGGLPRPPRQAVGRSLLQVGGDHLHLLLQHLHHLLHHCHH